MMELQFKIPHPEKPHPEVTHVRSRNSVFTPMAFNTDCFNHFVEHKNIAMSYDEEFSFMIQGVKDYNGSFHYGILVEELLKGED